MTSKDFPSPGDDPIVITARDFYYRADEAQSRATTALQAAKIALKAAEDKLIADRIDDDTIIDGHLAPLIAEIGRAESRDRIARRATEEAAAVYHAALTEAGERLSVEIRAALLEAGNAVVKVCTKAAEAVDHYHELRGAALKVLPGDSRIASSPTILDTIIGNAEILPGQLSAWAHPPAPPAPPEGTKLLRFHRTSFVRGAFPDHATRAGGHSYNGGDVAAVPDLLADQWLEDGTATLAEAPQ